MASIMKLALFIAPLLLVIFVLVLANEGFVNLDDFDPATGNDSEEMGSEEKLPLVHSRTKRGTCWGWNGGKDCRKYCQKITNTRTGRKYRTGACEWSSKLLTCVCY